MSFRLKLAGIEMQLFCIFLAKNSCSSPTRGAKGLVLHPEYSLRNQWGAKRLVLHPEQTAEDGRWQYGNGIANAVANVYF